VVCIVIIWFPMEEEEVSFSVLSARSPWVRIAARLLEHKFMDWYKIHTHRPWDSWYVVASVYFKFLRLRIASWVNRSQSSHEEFEPGHV